MDFDREWTGNEERLLRQADSLGGLLAQIRDHFPPILIRGGGWRRLREHTDELPASLAAFPMWVGFPVHTLRPGADFGVSLVGGSRAAAFFEEKGRSEGAHSCMAGVASLLKETAPEQARLRRITGPRVLLDYNVDSMRSEGRRYPGFFLYPIKHTLAGGGKRRLEDFGIVLDAVNRAAGWDPDPAERRNIEGVYLALGRGARLGAVGAFPARSKAVRLTALGFGATREAVEFAQRAGWPARHSVLASTLSRLEQRGALAGMHLGVDLEVGPAGLGPALELHIFSENTISDSSGWFKDEGHWTALIDGMREEGLGVAGKLSALAEWSPGAKMLFGKFGLFVLLQRIHHIKLVLTQDRVEQVNAYIFMLMGSWRQAA